MKLSISHITWAQHKDQIVSDLLRENSITGIPPVLYDMRSIHADLFAGQNGYQYSQKETLLAVRAYAQSEPKTLKDKS